MGFTQYERDVIGFDGGIQEIKRDSTWDLPNLIFAHYKLV